MLQIATKAFFDFAHLFYPDLCILCESEVKLKEDHFCLGCSLDLPITDHFENPDNQFMKHFWGRVRVEMAAALFHMEKQNGVRAMIHRLKYKNSKHLGILLGKLIGRKYLESSFSGLADYVVPVPISKNKLKLRRYNQAGLIADGISLETGIETRKSNLLKVGETKTQTRKSRWERVENMKECFVVKDPLAMVNKHILLVDDVATTGATLEACIRAMENIVGIRISVLTIGIAYS